MGQDEWTKEEDEKLIELWRQEVINNSSRKKGDKISWKFFKLILINRQFVIIRIIVMSYEYQIIQLYHLRIQIGINS